MFDLKSVQLSQQFFKAFYFQTRVFLMQVCISTWGDPSGWKTNATYIKKGKLISSFTTLTAYDDCKEILLLVQDSILVHRNVTNSEIIDCINDTYDIVLNPFNRLSNPLDAYKNWLKTVKKYVLCAVEKARVDKNRVRVIVVPGIGKFEGNINNQTITYYFGVLDNKQKCFAAQQSSNKNAPKVGQQNITYLPLSYLESLLAYNIYNVLKQMSVDEIVLDITHGLNYFASLAQTVTTRIASLLNVKLEVINFIPTVMYEEYMYKEIFLQDKGAKFDIYSIKKLSEGAKKALILSLQFGSILPIFYICKIWKTYNATL